MLTTLELSQRLRVSIGRLARRLRQQSLAGLTPSQSSVLATLDSNGSMAMSAVADHEAISRPSATGIVDRLVDKGLVRRTTNPADHRSSLVEITAKGETLLEQRRKEKTAYLADAISRLTRQERETLARAVPILEKLERSP